MKQATTRTRKDHTATLIIRQRLKEGAFILFSSIGIYLLIALLHTMERILLGHR